MADGTTTGGTVAVKRGRSPDPRVLEEIVRRIVAVADPEKIIMFGSAARGEMGPNSDIDLLVIKEGAHERRLAQKIYVHLHGIAEVVDSIAVTPEDVERYRNSWPLVIYPALREGKVIYERTAGFCNFQRKVLSKVL